jgi:TolB-like protein
MEARMSASQIQIGSLTLQPRRQLLKEGQPLPLGRKALDILSVLAEAGGELVTKDELLASVWPGVVVEENALQVHVAALRKALGGEAERLTTARGLGYRLNVPQQAMTVPSRGDRRYQSSIAVLPFANLTGEPSKDYLANGIAQELIATLSRATDLKVPSATSSFYYKGRTADVRAIGRHLGVDTVLEGWMKFSGSRIRVSAQLIDAATGFHLWAETFDRPVTEMIALDEELAAAIAGALRTQLRPIQSPTTNLEAFDLYLQAQALHLTPTADNLRTSIAYLTRAIELDPRFSRAHAYMALDLCNSITSGIRGPDALKDARRHAEQAILIDPSLWQGHSALAFCGLLEGNWSLAEEHCGEHDLCPVRGGMLSTLGYLQAARTQTEHTMVLDPNCTSSTVVCATIHWQIGDQEASLRRTAGAISLGYPAELMPLPFFRADAALAAGDWQVASEILAEGLPQPWLDCDGAAVVRRICAAAAGEGGGEIAIASLDRFVKRLEAADLLRLVPTGLPMSFFARLGALDQAFRLADDMILRWQTTGLIEQPSLMFFWLPQMQEFRDDPRFEGIADRLGFTAFWRRHGPPDCHADRPSEAEAVAGAAA